MELDDVKTAWQTLDRRLQQKHALELQLFKDSRLDKARGSLRPLLWGQVAQIVFGVSLLLLGVSYWTQHRDSPLLLTMGILVHAFGAITAVMGGITIAQISRIDYAAPVVAIQKQFAQLRRTYVLTGLVAGLPWWFMWMPVTMTVFGLLGADLSGLTWGFFLPCLAFGVAGLFATWGFHRWSRSPKRTQLGRAIEEGLTGGSLRRAMARIEDISRFERE